MKILSAAQIKELDTYTITHEPIASIELMERAATACTNWIVGRFEPKTEVVIFCGTGNNGGDGLAIARQLRQHGYKILVFVLDGANKSKDFAVNFERWQQLGEVAHVISSENNFPLLSNAPKLIVDAIFGSGLNRQVAGITANLIQYLNQLDNKRVVSIDIPSGLFCEDNANNNYENIINATYTLSLQLPKLALLLPDNQAKVGEMFLLPIGLSEAFIKSQNSDYHFITKDDCLKIYKPRQKFAHKGTYGHALIVTGSKGKMGAAVLAAKACLRAGAGLVTAYIPQCGYNIMQISVPEVMVIENEGTNFLQGTFTAYSYTIGIGSGIGTDEKTAHFLCQLLQQATKPMVIDADALNLLALHQDWWPLIPAHSILTPHPKEFGRWVGVWKNDSDKLEKLKKLAKQLQCHIVLKGAYTAVACPDGSLYFNSTGNPGMATGGSGDVLTGILTSLLAQGYAPKEASIMGVYLHGLSGDLAAKENSEEALIASDIIRWLGKAYSHLKEDSSEK